MSHIKCRYNEIYCDSVIYRGNARAKLCNGEKCGNAGAIAECDYQWVAEEQVCMCECAYPDIIEFEKTVKEYEYNSAENILRIGKQYYSFIEYLEIDGRVVKHICGKDGE